MMSFLARGRGGLLALAGLLMAVRLLSPVGFMPSWDADRFAITLCGDLVAPAGNAHGAGQHDDQQQDQTVPQPCPYAAAASLGLLGPEASFALETPNFAAPALNGVGLWSIRRHRAAELSRSRAPPLLP